MQHRIKTEAQIQAMREGGRIIAQIYADLKTYVQPGMSELEIDAWVATQIKKQFTLCFGRCDFDNTPVTDHIFMDFRFNPMYSK